MVLINDDPIIACMERTGYPPWFRDRYEEDEEIHEEEEVDEDEEEEC